MSELGIHVASENRNGFGAVLSAGAACVVTIDHDVVKEVREKAPKAVIAFRTQKSPLGEDNPANLLQTPSIANEWMASLFPIWDANPGADYYIVNNELDVSDLASARALNEFYVRCMIFAKAQGYRIGICSFSTGCPSDDAGLTLEQRWEPLLPAVQMAARDGHVIVLHAHAMNANLMDVPEDIAFRHERSLAFFAQHGLHPTVLIGELSNGTGGVQPNLDIYTANVGWWDLRAMSSPWRDQVLGGALYGFNAGESLTEAVPELVDWINTHPQETIPPAPLPDEPRAYDRVCRLVPPSVPFPKAGDPIDPRFEKIVNDSEPNRESVFASADDAFAVVPQCKSRTVYVYNVAEWGGKAALEAWVDKFYGPRPPIIYLELTQ